MATDLTQYVEEARREWDSPAQKLTGIPSSSAYDAKLIAWYCVYHTGRWPHVITTGRGHSYNVRMDWRGKPHSVRITNYQDHRNGVQGLGLGAYV